MECGTPSGNASSNICGTWVVLPEPVGATSTRRLAERSASTICEWICQMGREEFTANARQQPGRACGVWRKAALTFVKHHYQDFEATPHPDPAAIELRQVAKFLIVLLLLLLLPKSLGRLR